MPLTPPAALISLIAIIVASCSDFSTIERPPVSENSTPTLISPAACAPVENTHGEVINAPPARAPLFKNLRRSTAIPHTPRCPGTRPRSRRSTLLAAKIRPERIELRRRAVRRRLSSVQKTKKPDEPFTGSSGYLADEIGRAHV